MTSPGDEAAALRMQVVRLQRLLQAGQAIHTTLDLDELLSLILRVAVEGVGAERGTVFLVDAGKQQLWSRVQSGEGRLEIRLPLGVGIAGSVAAGVETVRIADAYEDPRFDRSWDQKSGFRTRQILCAPIRSREGKTVGVFQLLNKLGAPEFTEDDAAYLAAISVDAAMAVENAQLHISSLEKDRFDREVRLAQGVQRQLQPETRSATKGVLAAAGCNELCEDASGDYYDILFDLPGDRLAVAVGDVSGHGLQAALVMAEARAFLRAFLKTTDGLTHAMNLLNDLLVPDMQPMQFISLFVAVLDTGTGEVEWCNAGHNAPYLVRADGEVRELETTGRVPGILAPADYRAGRPFRLGAGDLMFLYTDGVTEARSPEKELWGEERLQASLALAAKDVSLDAGAVLRAVRGDLRSWTGPGRNEDDVTMLAVRHVGLSPRIPPPAPAP